MCIVLYCYYTYLCYSYYHHYNTLQHITTLQAGDKTILRLASVPIQAFSVSTTSISKSEACLYFPALPRSWLTNGLIMIPSISETSKKGEYLYTYIFNDVLSLYLFTYLFYYHYHHYNTS